MQTTVNDAEVAKFSAMAEEWWNPQGKFKPIHKFNPVRLSYIRENAIRQFGKDYPGAINNFHVTGGINPSVKEKNGTMWISDGYYGLDQGIILMMIENYRSGLIWDLMRENPTITKGLRLAGFNGGWLRGKGQK